MTITRADKIHFWRPAAWLRVSGPDAGTFLQGQFSNDLGLLSTRPAVYGLWLNQKGRVLADSFVLKGSTAEEFWVGSYFSSGTAIRERLESHIIADDVVVADESAASGYGADARFALLRLGKTGHKNHWRSLGRAMDRAVQPAPRRLRTGRAAEPAGNLPDV